MRRLIRFRPRAEIDIDEHYLHFAEKGGIELAERFFESVHATVRDLAASIELGIRYDSVYDQLTDMLVWKVNGFPNHLVFHLMDEDSLEVVRILHGARDIEAMFERGEMT